ncbi:hypothetical protein MBAV_005841 [Candidatus Magnetobacterium bavaricum]|uniref:Uncharacterized protein n=1 Tax=Candidatus Magnetobacterium bavaricum TaxID=29290 RepID=A0A0F3GMR5_9BACT|nr:hypothetical protein MBAV_005841 [Candidatus Magnetobacterium bavaricum]
MKYDIVKIIIYIYIFIYIVTKVTFRELSRLVTSKESANKENAKATIMRWVISI